VRQDPWLAERLGMAVLTVEAGDDPATVARAAAERAPAFAQAKVACEDMRSTAALQDAGFRVVDVNVTLSCPARPGAAPAGVDEAREADREAVLDLAERHFTVSRFHRDPAIPSTAAAAIKRDWAAAYFDGQRGERLLVARRATRPIGFLGVLAPEAGVRVIDIVAVDTAERGAKVGSSLVTALLASFSGRVDVGTQIANTGALRFYERLGFLVTDTRYVLHLHA
jgi:ribosomal protein S18 acetylase RimI-like enzyme